jgi:transcriptional regulator with XRE-family HTH domain
MATNARAIGPLTRQVAAEIRATRARLKLTQDALAMATGIPANSLSQMENGKMAIDVEQIERIALAFGIPPEKFFAAALSNARADTHAGLANQGSGANERHPDDDWEIGTPSPESIAILRAEAEANPDS